MYGVMAMRHWLEKAEAELRESPSAWPAGFAAGARVPSTVAHPRGVG